MDTKKVRVYKTLKELYENRPNNKPFIVKTGNGDENVVVPIDDKIFAYSSMKQTSFILNPVSYYTTISRLEIVDWFPSKKKNKGSYKCTCDFVSVILVSGCKCGGV